jgi:hypothetical protein
MKSYRTGPETARLEHRAFAMDDAKAFLSLNGHPDVMRLTGETPDKCPSSAFLTASCEKRGIYE